MLRTLKTFGLIIIGAAVGVYVVNWLYYAFNYFTFVCGCWGN